jgi:hypothetical protein
MKTQLKFKVDVMKGPHAGATYTFDKATVSIGRGPENDIILSNDSRVSRQHAEIKLNGQDYYILNLSQKNFVLLNGARVQSERLDPDCVIQVGETELKFIHDKPAPPPPRPMPSPELPKATPPSMFAGVAPMNQGSQVPQVPPMGGVNPYSPPAYQPPPPAMGNPRPPLPGGGGSSGSKVRFYVIVGIVLFVGWFFFSGGVKRGNKDPNAIRTTEQITSDLQNADKIIEQLEKRKKQLNEVQYARAQENFIKGFRDFQQGQYARARESFQVVLNLDPDNDLAKRYLQLSKIKFDEMVKFSMIQGARYREKKNWRLCQSSFFNVMTMLQNRKDDQTYLEAKRYYDECSLNLEGRY